MSIDTGTADLTPRQKLLWSMYDFSVGHGLEVGPLHQCIAPRTRCDVKYVDVFDRATLQANWKHDPAVPLEQIPEIDYVLLVGGQIRSIPEAIGDGVDFDWAMASHVIEHVPDVIGWLDQIAGVVKDGGDLVLAIPDRRYCFDLHRPGTTVGQIIQAHELGDVVPSVRAVYDYSRNHASVRAPMIWSGEPVGYENRIYDLEAVLDRVEQARNGVYIDSHVWTFTPGSFLETIIELRALGLCDWKVDSLIPTPHNQLEFYAVLTRLPRSQDWPPELFVDEPKPGRMPDWLEQWAELQRELKATSLEVTRLRTRVAKLKSERAALRAGTDERHRRKARRLSKRLKGTLRAQPGGEAMARAFRAARRRRGK